MRKGFALDDERLKNLGGGGYFKELLERIRNIRTPKRCFIDRCLKSTQPVLTMTPRRKSPFSFSRKSKIKFIMPFTGKPRQRSSTHANAEKEFMGLTTFAGSQPTLKEAVLPELSERERASCYGAACLPDISICGTTGGARAGNDHAGLVSILIGF